MEETTKKLSEVERTRALISAKKRHGDRADAKLIRDTDGLHLMMAVCLGSRTANEAFVHEDLCMDKMDEFLAKKNQNLDGKMRLSPFVVIVAAVLKTIALRPRMNRFLMNNKVYQRNEISAAFIIRKHFNDDSDEAMAYIIPEEDGSLLDNVWRQTFEQIADCRQNDKIDPTSASVDFLMKKLPGPIGRFIVRFLLLLDRHGKIPQSVVEGNLYFSSVCLSYLGSLRMKSGYHHLADWGSNSFFITVGERKFKSVTDRKGNTEMKDVMDVTMTLDERIADGYYFAKSIRLFKKLVENPELLELPLFEEIMY